MLASNSVSKKPAFISPSYELRFCFDDEEEVHHRTEQISKKCLISFKVDHSSLCENLSDIKRLFSKSELKIDQVLLDVVRTVLGGKSVRDSIASILGTPKKDLECLISGQVSSENLDKFLNLDFSKIKSLPWHAEFQKSQNDLLVHAVENSWISLHNLDYFWSSVCQTVFDDEAVMLRLLNLNPQFLELASPRLMSNLKFLEKISEFCDFSYFTMVPCEFFENKIIARNFISRNGILISMFSETIQKDAEIALIALKNSPSNSIWVSRELLQNREFVIRAIHELDPESIFFFDSEIFADEQLAYLLVKKSGCAFRHISKYFSNHKGMVLEAVKSDPQALVFVGNSLYQSEKRAILEGVTEDNIFAEAMKSFGIGFQYLDPELSQNPFLATLAVENCPDIWRTLSLHLRENYNVASLVLSKKGIFFLDLSERLQQDEELAKIAVAQDPHIIDLLPDQFKYSLSVISAAIQVDWSILHFVIGRDLLRNQLLKEIYLMHPLQVMAYLHYINLPKSEMESFRVSALEHIDGELKEKILRLRNVKSKDFLIFLLHQFHQKSFLPSIAEIAKNRAYAELVILIFCSFSLDQNPVDFYKKEGGILDKFIKPTHPTLARERKAYLKNLRNQAMNLFIEFMIAVRNLKISLELKLQIINQISSIHDVEEALHEMRGYLTLIDSDIQITEQLCKLSSEERKRQLVQNLLSQGFLDESDIQQFLRSFLDTREPSAIFRYAANFYDDPLMKACIRDFIQQVCHGVFISNRRMRTTEHTKKIPHAVWSSWTQGLHEKVNIDNCEYQAVDTDSWEDMLLSGSEVLGSCLRIDGSPNYNCSLMAYIMDPKIRMIGLKDAYGKIKARAIIKILLNGEGKPVLFLEKAYSDDMYHTFIVDYAVQKASKCGIDVYVSGETFELSSLGTNVPYEYEDGIHVINFSVTNGLYNILADKLS